MFFFKSLRFFKLFTWSFILNQGLTYNNNYNNKNKNKRKIIFFAWTKNVPNWLILSLLRGRWGMKMSKSGHVVHFVSSSHSLSLFNNNIACSCFLSWFIGWQKKSRFKVILFLFRYKLNQAFPSAAVENLSHSITLCFVCGVWK